MVREVKVMMCGKDIELEKALFIWFKQKREDGIPISGVTVIIYVSPGNVFPTHISLGMRVSLHTYH